MTSAFFEQRIEQLQRRLIRLGPNIERARHTVLRLETQEVPAGAVAPAREGRLSSQSPRGSPAVYASWTTSFLPYPPWCGRSPPMATSPTGPRVD